MKANLLLKQMLIITITCFVVSGCGSNSEETIDSSSALPWMDKIVDAPEDLDSDNVYTFVCESIIKKPVRMTTTCADFGEEVLDIKWSTWGARGAKGIGIYSVNNCQPDCSDGTRVTTPVYLWLNGTTTDGRNYYLNDLFIVPKDTYKSKSSTSVVKDSQFSEEFSLENRKLHGQKWNLVDFWKSNPKFRDDLPE